MKRYLVSASVLVIFVLAALALFTLLHPGKTSEIFIKLDGGLQRGHDSSASLVDGLERRGTSGAAHPAAERIDRVLCSGGVANIGVTDARGLLARYRRYLEQGSGCRPSASVEATSTMC